MSVEIIDCRVSPFCSHSALCTIFCNMGEEGSEDEARRDSNLERCKEESVLEKGEIYGIDAERGASCIKQTFPLGLVLLQNGTRA